MPEPKCYAKGGSANLEYCHDEGCSKCKFAAGDPANEIVALQFGPLIVFSHHDAQVRIARGEQFEMITRQRMQLMANADLGEKWRRAAEAPTLFLKSEVINDAKKEMGL